MLVILRKIALALSAKEEGGWMRIEFIREECGLVTVQKTDQRRMEKREEFKLSWRVGKMRSQVQF